MYKKLFATFTFTLSFMAGCNSTNNSLPPPVFPYIGHIERTNVKATEKQIYAAAIRALESDGERLEVNNPDGVFISTVPRKIQFTTDLIACLPNQNIDTHLVQTEISYTVMILNNKLGVRVPVNTFYQSENSSERTELPCFSNTTLEKELTKKILAEIK